MRKILIFAGIFVIIFSACKKEPEHVSVQHILIAFKGSIPKDEVIRTREDAEKLAMEILKKAKQGEDFDAMVKQYSDDQYPGIYKMANTKIIPDEDRGEFSRTRMVKAFGDVGFSLKIGKIGLAVYDSETSKYGWHVIKRIK